MTDFTELQERMERTYGERDRARGISGHRRLAGRGDG